MHILLLVLGGLATAAFWIYRAGKVAPDVLDAAQTVANMPRRRRHAKAVNRRGLDLVETPVEAATVLMLAISRMSEDRRLSDAERSEIERLLIREMRLERDEADGLVLQMEVVHDDVTLPESALFPMVDILRESIERDDARRLADMLTQVSVVEGQTAEQRDFIRRYRERMGIGG